MEPELLVRLGEHAAHLGAERGVGGEGLVERARAAVQERPHGDAVRPRLRRPGDPERLEEEGPDLEGLVAFGGDALGGDPELPRLPGGHRAEPGEHDERRGHAGDADAMTSHEGADPVAERGRPRLDRQPLEVPAHVVGEGGDRRVALARLLAQRLHRDRVEVAGDRPATLRRRDGGGRRRVALEDLARQLLLRALPRLAEGVPVGEQLVEEDAERPDVARRGHSLAAELLGRGVARREPSLGEARGVPVRLLGVQDLRDPEVEQLRHAGGRDQDVPRLEVAVDEQPLVRVVDRGADVAEEREARRDVESVPAAVLQDVDAVDVLHDEVREPVVRRADVEQARDVRVVERRQDPALGAEAAQHVFGVEPASHELDRDVSAEVGGLVRGQVDATHPAAPEEPLDTVRADAIGEVGVRPPAQPWRRAIQQAGRRRLVRGEERLDLGAERGVRLRPLEERGPLRRRQFHGLGKERLDSRPASRRGVRLCRRHRYASADPSEPPARSGGASSPRSGSATPARSGSASPSSRRSQARAASQARRTVIGETSISAAISS